MTDIDVMRLNYLRAKSRERFLKKTIRVLSVLVVVLSLLLLASPVEAKSKFVWARVPVCAEDDVLIFDADRGRNTNYRCANFDDLVTEYVIDRATTWDPGLQILLHEAGEIYLDRIAEDLAP